MLSALLVDSPRVLYPLGNSVYLPRSCKRCPKKNRKLLQALMDYEGWCKTMVGRVIRKLMKRVPHEAMDSLCAQSRVIQADYARQVTWFKSQVGGGKTKAE
eukprot:Hpha_TRINITY_DN23147_c0_g1::TRINITY_DN23147_c0_g1_i1::g.29646::m.29646